MDMQKMEQSQSAMERLNSAVDELVRIIERQKLEFNTQMIAEKNKAQTAENKAAVLEAQNRTLAEENEKLRVQLIAAQNNTENEEKIKSLQAEVEARGNKINGLQTEVQNLNTALSNRKMQIEELNNKNSGLVEKLNSAEAKIGELESNSVREDNAAAELQIRLDEALVQNETLKQQYQQSEEHLSQVRQTVSQTSENIDDVVAKLEKVLKENGASDNNDR